MMQKDKASPLNGFVIWCSFLFVFIGLGLMVYSHYMNQVIIGASFFIVGGLGLIVEVLIHNLKSMK